VPDALNRLRDRHKRDFNFPDATGRQQKQRFINEPGFYRLVMHSHKPEAERFQDWVTKDVLPTIRRTGRYRMPPRRLVDHQRDGV
jgi:prophage antirepressor-like protein